MPMKHPLAPSWKAMIRRCTNPSDPTYRWYGARGIRVCERWLTFANFAADMGARPVGLSLDRINNDGNYEPGNCRWATHAQQMANRRPMSCYRATTAPRRPTVATTLSQVRGERVGSSKLVPEVVVAIRAERQAGATLGAMAKKWRVSSMTIGNVVNRKTWRHVE